MQKFSNLAQTKLASAVTEIDTTISVTDAEVFPALGPGDWCMAVLFTYGTDGETRHEIVRVTAVDGNDLTVERAREGFAAQEYDAGDYIEVRNTAGSMEDLWKAAREAHISEQATTAYTLTAADAGRYIRMDHADPNTVTIPADATLAFPTGTQIHIRQAGAGQTSVEGATGVTLNTAETLNLRTQHSTATLVKVGVDEWDLMGDLEASA